MTVETQYNVVKVNELREISFAQPKDEIVINDIDSNPLETKKITVEDLAFSMKDYILPIATEDILGGIKVGDGLTINPVSGVLSNDILIVDDLRDVIVLNAEPGQTLIYNGNQWVNQFIGGMSQIVAGEGLIGGGTEGIITLHVNVGPGLAIRDDQVTMNVGPALDIVDDVLVVNVGGGLSISSNSIIFNPGSGLEVRDNFVNVVIGKGLTYTANAIEAYLGDGLTFQGNKIVANITDNLHFFDGKIDVSPTAFASDVETLGFAITDKAVNPKGLGYTLGKPLGILQLDHESLVQLNYIPKIPANKLRTIPQVWVAGTDNFLYTANFTHNHLFGTLVELGSTPITDHVGDSGFIYVQNSNKQPLTGINDAQWKGINNTWFNIEENEFGLTTDVIISYYVATDRIIVYSASGIQ